VAAPGSAILSLSDDFTAELGQSTHHDHALRLGIINHQHTLDHCHIAECHSTYQKLILVHA
jgi:hypothetical protein